ncbi:hypothetical protein [Lichenifustis flavocetrariae]|uniref:Uncharacterized protein n=1 Tax=Lichenifustis flavocetrariae TaxID=2949735 RepID=A0AA41YSH8_9HYPH|nr:hypothetical protein [Lichenifustis flavocetrariae]MCW6507359.1 hypothetical protein [Lichenifustis flavocetrariae]
MLSNSNAVLEEHFQQNRLDTVLSSLGVSAAVVSASFAGYMLVIGPGDGTSSSPMPAIDSTAAPDHPRLSMAGAPSHGPLTRNPAGVDFTPTGTILDPAGELGRRPNMEARSPATILSDYAVRDAFDGTALVEAHGTLQVVRTGTVLEGAGEVLAISRTGNSWTVTTSVGTILQRR